MARGRLISKCLGTSRKFHALYGVAGKLAEFAQALYPLIVAGTDDFGRMPGDAFTVKHAVFPISGRTEREFDQALSALHQVGLIQLYTVENSRYLQVDNFDAHQPNLHKRSAPRYPSPPEVPGNSGNFPESLGTTGLNPEPRTQNPEETDLRSAAARPSVEIGNFARFWLAYPRKLNKRAAVTAYRRHVTDEQIAAVVLDALEAAKRSPDWRRDGGRFIPYAASWLNAKRWEDEHPETNGIAPGTIADDDVAALAARSRQPHVGDW